MMHPKWNKTRFAKIFPIGETPAEHFAELHNENVEGAKFKIGEKVNVRVDYLQISPVNLIGIITGVNLTDDDDSRANIYEYSIDNWGFLFWEEQLKRVKNNDI